MNKKITLFFLQFLFVTSQVVSAQQIYTNGPLSTGATTASGVAAPAGSTWSEVQSDTGNTTESNTSFGYSSFYFADGSTSFVIADDFVVPAGETWNVTSFDFFIYQTNFTGTTPPIDELRVVVYNGNPSTGGTVLAGNLTANVYDATNSAPANIFRTGNSVTPAPGTTPGQTRRVFRVRGNLTTSLPSGTYWVGFQGHAINNASFFTPPVTVPGVRGLPEWNAQQLTVPTNAWTAVIDGGNPATAPDVPQSLAFLVNGTVLGVDENAFEASISLSPNPVKDVLSLSVPTNVTVKSYEIIDLNGRIVKSMTSPVSISEINVTELSLGNYVLKLYSDQGSASKKFIKE